MVIPVVLHDSAEAPKGVGVSPGIDEDDFTES